jgi:hypothetical protein
MATKRGGIFSMSPLVSNCLRASHRLLWGCLPLEQLTRPKRNKHYMWYQKKTMQLLCLQALAGNEYEKAAHSYRDGQEHDQNSNGAPVQCLLDEWLLNLVEVEKGILAVSNKGDEGVEHILVGEDEVNRDGEWKDDLHK